MRVLVACEFSGTVRDAFASRGHDAWSCDLIDTEKLGNHIKGNVLDYLDGWDLMIAHPPCTYLAVSGAAWFKIPERQIKQAKALQFVKDLMDAPIYKICIENPISIISTRIRKPEQIIQPYMFGHKVKKTTCLWLKNLPQLKPTKIVDPKITTLKTGAKFSTWDYKISMDHENRSKLRSITFQGIADAMAEQWSKG